MEVDVLVEPIAGDRFRARTGEPFAVTAEGGTDDEAVSRVRAAVAERIRDGAKLVRIHIGIPGPANPLPDDDLTREWIEELKRIRRESNQKSYPWEESEAESP